MDEFEHYLDDDEDVEHYLDDDDNYVETTSSNERLYGTGKRKTSIARVWIYDGSGQFIVNGKKAIDYFHPVQREYCIQPLVTTETIGQCDVWCTVKGGGYTGQSGAVRLGITRALDLLNPSFRPLLRQAGMLTRDSRRVEKKKAGKKKARKQYQWVKR